MYVAGQGDDSGSGAGLYRFDLVDGTWIGRCLADVPQLSSLVLHPTEPMLYGVSGFGEQGRLHGWRLENGQANRIAEVDSGGAVPCDITVHPAGPVVVIAHYTSGTLASWRLDSRGVPVDEPVVTLLSGVGSLGEPARQDRPHPHQVLVVGGELVVPDLGADLVRRFRIDAHGVGDEIGSYPLDAGTGPRHAAVAKDGTLAVGGELAQTVVFPNRRNAPSISSTRRGAFTPQSLRNHPGDLKIGNELGYLANRGHDTIGVFSLGDRPELVAEVESGVRWPQHLLIIGDALFVAGRDSSEVVSLRLDPHGIPREPTACFDCPGAAWLCLG